MKITEESIKAFVVESELYDSPIVCKSIGDVHCAIDCMHNESPIDLDKGTLFTVETKEFSPQEYELIMSREWQP